MKQFKLTMLLATATKGKLQGILITWKKNTSESKKQEIRNDFSGLYSSIQTCDMLNEIWVDYCHNCQPFYDPDEDPDAREYIQSTAPAVSCPTPLRF